MKILIKNTYLIIVVLLFSCKDSSVHEKVSNEKDTPWVENTGSEENNDTLYAVLMVGDMMLGTNYPNTSSLPPDDGKYLLDDAKDFIQSADVSIGNLEGTLLNSGGTPKVCKDPEHCVAFRMPEHYAGYIADAGFNIVSVANNHSGDMGDIGRESTVKTLEKYGIKYAGYETCPTTIFERNGVKFGFTAFAPNSGTQDLLNLDAAIARVKELRTKCDILVVSFHGGAEGSGATRVTRHEEIFLGEDRGNVYEFAHAMVDAGADIVMGQGPHVSRALELYSDRIISYSLGNFCTYGKFGLSGDLGLTPVLKVFVDKDGEFVKGRIFPFKQLKRGGPVFDDDYKVIDLIRRLCKQDFPDSRLVIQNDGKIDIKE